MTIQSLKKLEVSHLQALTIHLAVALTDAAQIRNFLPHWTSCHELHVSTVCEHITNVLNILCRAPIKLQLSQHTLTLFDDNSDFHSAAFVVPLSSLLANTRLACAMLIENWKCCMTQSYINGTSCSPVYTHFTMDRTLDAHLDRRILVNAYVEELISCAKEYDVWLQLRPTLCALITQLMLENIRRTGVLQAQMAASNEVDRSREICNALGSLLTMITKIL